jgi:hypothetical protein
MISGHGKIGTLRKRPTCSKVDLALFWNSESELVEVSPRGVHRRGVDPGSCEREIEIFRPGTGRIWLGSSPCTFAFEEDGAGVFCRLYHHNLFSVRAGKPSGVFDVSEQGRAAITFEERVEIWNSCSGVSHYSHSVNMRASVVTWDRNEGSLALASESGVLFICRPGQREQAIHTDESGKIDRILWGRLNTYLVLIQGSLLTYVFLHHSLGQAASIRQYRMPAPIVAADLRPWGSEIAVGLDSGELRIVASCRFRRPRLHRFEGSIAAVAWSPSGKRIAICGDCGEIHVLRVCR